MISAVVVAKDGFCEFPLKAILKRLNISQAELSRRTAIKPTYISRLVRGRTNPNWQTIMVIACALNLDIGELNASQLS